MFRIWREVISCYLGFRVLRDLNSWKFVLGYIIVYRYAGNEASMSLKPLSNLKA